MIYSGQEAGEQAALVQRAAHQSESVLAGARPHAAHKALLVEAPHLPDPVRDTVTAQPPDALCPPLVAGGHHQAGRHLRSRPTAIPDSLRDDVPDGRQPDPLLSDQLGAASVDVVAIALAQILHVEPGLVTAEVQREQPSPSPVLAE